MPLRNTFFEENVPVHIISRAIEEIKIFDEETDCYRFMFQIFAANIGRPAYNLWKKDVISAAKAILAGESPSEKFVKKKHDPMVSFLSFALVKNHYHFYLLPNIENGIPLYMQKLNMGFAKYFNVKYNRKGSLFGSRYKSIIIKTEFQASAIDRYINIVNPLDIYQPGWRKEGLKNSEDAFNFLENYQFSSFPERIGKRDSKILAPKEVLEKYIELNNDKNKNIYHSFVKEFSNENLTSISPIDKSMFLE